MVEKTENVQIQSTMLGYEDHGIMSFMLHLRGDGWGQGFGGNLLDEYDKDADKRVPTVLLGFIVQRLLETFDVREWSDLKGLLVRVKHDDGTGCSQRLLAIGHIVKDRWFRADEVQEFWKKQQGSA